LKAFQTILKIHILSYVFLFFTILTFGGLNLAFADTSNPLTDKEEFDVAVSGISHKSILVSVSINGHTQNYKIKGNPSYVSAPTVQEIIFKFARNLHATPPTASPIKLGDIWLACIKIQGNKASCSSLPVFSLTQPQKMALDARYIPGQNNEIQPVGVAPFG
jgi:hypothetical protein